MFWPRQTETTVAMTINLATKADSRKNECREGFQQWPIQKNRPDEIAKAYCFVSELGNCGGLPTRSQPITFRS